MTSASNRTRRLRNLAQSRREEAEGKWACDHSSQRKVERSAS